MAIYTVSISNAGTPDTVALGDGSTLAKLEVSAGRGPKGDGFTGGSYEASTGVVTFTSNEGLGFSTDDLRSFTDGSYNSTTGEVTFTSNTGVGFTTGDIRGGSIDETLGQIATTKTETAVDVFVYDTSRDSDGGAWRKRTQHTSWYNETLNTSTRGSRREFPAVAVIVAEATKVTIYDGDDPALPMWMVFNRGSDSYFLSTAQSATSLPAFNGVLVFGTSSTGIRLINFVGDFGRFVRNINDDRMPEISGRNTGVTTTPVGTNYIVNGAVNDVAMTILPDSPIDPATGLPVPTIAVATGGGVSVIKDDGTVVDLTHIVNTNNEAGGVWFPSSGGIAWQSRGAGVGYVYTLVENEIPSSDKSTAPDALYANFGQVNFLGNDLVILGTSQPREFIDGAIGSPDGLTRIDEKPTSPSEGMVAYTTSTYNTGWMNGSIKGAFLSDTDDTDLVGGELWDTPERVDATWTDNGDGSYSSSGGLGVLGWNTTPKLEVGKQYIYSIEITSRTSGSIYLPYDGSGGNAVSRTSVQTYTGSFVANNTNLFIYSTSFVGSVDNISVKLVDEDRSVNANSLTVNGTITRTPVATGADLVAYSGFSTSNYLEQPYNPDLDFGTGDFCVMGWVKFASGQKGTILERNSTTSVTSSVLHLDVDSVGDLRMLSSNSFSSSGVKVDTGSWEHFAIVRKDGVMTVYKGGDIQTAYSATEDVTDTSATLRIGQRSSEDFGAQGSLALWRISATAPTAEQIAKIYEDEKVLFQENAGAVLAGTSDAVTSLAYDDATQELLVGTSQNTSVFRGLRRVETISGSASVISASNGLRVIED